MHSRGRSLDEFQLLVLLNSLVPGKFEWNFWEVIFKLILVIDGCGSSCEITLRWLALNLTDDKSTLVQVKAWCQQATSTWVNVDPDLCHHTASSLCLDEKNAEGWHKMQIYIFILSKNSAPKAPCFQWVNLLTILGKALEDNGIEYRSLVGTGKFQVGWLFIPMLFIKCRINDFHANWIYFLISHIEFNTVMMYKS